MADAAEFVKIIKKAAAEAVNAEKPVNICFGKVTGVSPLKILVEQKMTLGAAQLILSRHLTDYKCEVTAESCTEDHLSLRKSVIVHNGLAVGDEVILLRQQGGQKFLVWDRTT